MSGSENDQDDYLNIFEAPEGFYQAESPPTFVKYQTSRGIDLSLRLVGQSPLWGHLLWNAGRTLATYLETHATSFIHHKTVLELGAGAGLPSLICALEGARQVVVTDYPDDNLIENLRLNIERAKSQLPDSQQIRAEGYLWGAPVDGLTRRLDSNDGFDLLILGDLLFNHSEHEKLVSTVRQTLKRSSQAQALVFFTPYRPWLLEKDLAFFDIARSNGFTVEETLVKVMDEAMFTEDPGDETLRKTVFGYTLRWQQKEFAIPTDE